MNLNCAICYSGRTVQVQGEITARLLRADALMASGRLQEVRGGVSSEPNLIVRSMFVGHCWTHRPEHFPLPVRFGLHKTSPHTDSRSCYTYVILCFICCFLFALDDLGCTFVKAYVQLSTLAGERRASADLEGEAYQLHADQKDSDVDVA